MTALQYYDAFDFLCVARSGKNSDNNLIRVASSHVSINSLIFRFSETTSVGGETALLEVDVPDAGIGECEVLEGDFDGKGG